MEGTKNNLEIKFHFESQNLKNSNLLLEREEKKRYLK